MASGLKDFYFTFASRWLSLLLVVAGQSILAWSLGPGGRGSYAVCVIFVSLLTMIFTIASDSATIYLVASRRMTLSEGLFQGLLFAAIGSVLAIGTGLLVIQSDLEFFKKAERFDFYLVLMSLPFTKGLCGGGASAAGNSTV
jgi:O-antigen/teichoic acid export membrane protein